MDHGLAGVVIYPSALVRVGNQPHQIAVSVVGKIMPMPASIGTNFPPMSATRRRTDWNSEPGEVSFIKYFALAKADSQLMRISTPAGSGLVSTRIRCGLVSSSTYACKIFINTSFRWLGITMQAGNWLSGRNSIRVELNRLSKLRKSQTAFIV